MKKIINKLSIAGILFTLFMTFNVHAQWHSYEYRIPGSGEYRYGIRQGSEHVPLNEKDRKKADKAARKMNKNDKKNEKSVRDLHEPGCNEPGVVC